jgi:hypothetical protein
MKVNIIYLIEYIAERYAAYIENIYAIDFV